MSLDLLTPDWPVPATVRALSTTRTGGFSAAPWQSLNLGDHVGDAATDVAANREHLRQAAGLPCPPAWLRQVHGTDVVRLGRDTPPGAEADACWTSEPGVVCAILTADCLPVLFADRGGRCVGAAHAGWRGLLSGVLEQCVAAMPVEPAQLLAWLGPAIGPAAFEVGDEVRTAFVTAHPEDEPYFHPDGLRWRADLFELARARLRRTGLPTVLGGGRCTHSDPARFFSHRRDGLCGRQASLIWLA